MVVVCQELFFPLQSMKMATPNLVPPVNPAKVGPAPRPGSGSVQPTNFGQNTQSLGQSIQNSTNVKGAYGNWTGQPNPVLPPSRPGVNNQQPPIRPNQASQFNTPIQPQQSSQFPNQNRQAPANFNQAQQQNSANFSNRPPINQQASNNRPPTPAPRPQQRQPTRPNTVNTQPKGFLSGVFAPAPVQTDLTKLDRNSPEFLKQLSASDLRREVIQTEIDIQKTLIQTEKAYREGVSTIRDLISPSAVKINTGYIEIGTKICRSFFILTYPKVINSEWLEGVVNTDIPFDLSIFVYPRDSSEVLKELKGKVGKIQASLQLNQEKGAARDPALETAYRDVEGLRDAIQQGVEKFFRLGVYITIYANNLDQLEKYSQGLEGLLSQQNIVMKRAALQMDDGFNSSLPILKDDLNVIYNMNTSPLSAAFPFVSSELSSNDGILYGINRHNTSLIIFDRFELENANSVVFATSGAGKSYTVKLEILRSLMIGVNVIVIDPEQEYKVLADTLGGAYVSMSLNSNNRINPFDLPKALPGESTADILRSAIIDIIGLMNLMLGKLNPSELSIMERAISEAYAKRDITDSSDLNNVIPPTMQDLVEILNGIVGGESLAQRLYRYTEGTFAGIFNQRTNININNNFIVFNIRDLQEQLRPIAMYILLNYIWNEVRSTLQKRILAIDEAWIMMQYEDSARFLFGLAKRARKYYLGITTITQDVGDFLNSPFGKPIVTNAAMKILLKQSTAAIDGVANAFALTEGEKQVLLQSEVGQGIFFAGPRHVAIEIVAFPTEHKIITTNPKDILKMQGVEDAGAQ
jgi:conjugal transfer ATP-binding protein TraC